MAAARTERYTAVEIAERDGWRCQICGKRIGRSYKFPHPRSLSIDHIIPIRHGGDDVKTNVQAAHLRCNAAKGPRGVDQLRLIG
jgi:5-methylcytosine-specific restriction endonuclease McrA